MIRREDDRSLMTGCSATVPCRFGPPSTRCRTLTDFLTRYPFEPLSCSQSCDAAATVYRKSNKETKEQSTRMRAVVSFLRLKLVDSRPSAGRMRLPWAVKKEHKFKIGVRLRTLEQTLCLEARLSQAWKANGPYYIFPATEGRETDPFSRSDSCSEMRALLK